MPCFHTEALDQHKPCRCSQSPAESVRAPLYTPRFHFPPWWLCVWASLPTWQNRSRTRAIWGPVCGSWVWGWLRPQYSAIKTALNYKNGVFWCQIYLIHFFDLWNVECSILLNLKSFECITWIIAQSFCTHLKCQWTQNRFCRDVSYMIFNIAIYAIVSLFLFLKKDRNVLPVRQPACELLCCVCVCVCVR